MDWNTPHLGSWPAKLVLGISAKVRSKKAYTQQAIDKANAKEDNARIPIRSNGEVMTKAN
jgi:hypothetical protein